MFNVGQRVQVVSALSVFNGKFGTVVEIVGNRHQGYDVTVEKDGSQYDLFFFGGELKAV